MKNLISEYKSENKLSLVGILKIIFNLKNIFKFKYGFKILFKISLSIFFILKTSILFATTEDLFIEAKTQSVLNLPSGDQDATPILNAAAEMICNSTQSRTIYLPAGVYYFNTPPKPFPCALSLIGQGKGATRLIRNYSGGNFLHWQRGKDQSGGSLRYMNIEAGLNTEGGTAIYIQAEPDSSNSENSYNRHSFTIDDIMVTRSTVHASWDYGLYLDGSKNPDGNEQSVPGIRGIFVDHSSFSGTNIANVMLNKARGTNLSIECYVPLKDSAAAIFLSNDTWSVKLESRSCVFKDIDGTAKDLIHNGVRQAKL